MQIIISNQIEISEPTLDIINYCKSKLTYKNPDYEKKKRMGLWYYGTPKEIMIYNYYNGKYYLPIGCFEDIWKIHPYANDYKDYSVDVPIKITSNIQLRNYQEPCLEGIKTRYNGLFIMPAGTGKTLTALECVNHLKQKTLWLTHTKDLLNQAKGECEEHMSCTTSTITEGKCDCSGDIVFATVQTLVNIIDKEEISQTEFGLVIADECHHAVVSGEKIMQFQKCINYFASRYKIGLTATLHTANGMHVVIPKLIGGIIYELKKVDDRFIGYFNGTDREVVNVPANMFQVPARVEFIKTSYSPVGKDIYDKYNQTISFSKLITDISIDEDRNKLIISLLTQLKGSTIIVSDRTDQLAYLAKYFGKQAFFVDGKTKKSIREEGLEQVRLGKVKYLFATYKLICEGFNAPILENIVMATPVKDLRIVIQSVGRVQRPYPGKEIANVYDLVDDVGKLDKFVRERKKIYKKEGYEIIC